MGILAGITHSRERGYRHVGSQICFSIPGGENAEIQSNKFNGLKNSFKEHCPFGGVVLLLL